jgi:Protein of unknown function (DUF3309)
MSLGTILLIGLVPILVGLIPAWPLILVGIIPAWPHSRRWSYAPGGIVGLLLLVLLILLVLGRI